MPTEEVSAELVAQLRDKFLAESNNNSTEYNTEDIEAIKTNDWKVKRYLLAKKGNMDEALKMLITSMKWRKTIGVTEFTEKSFPKEYYQVGGVFTYGKDKTGSTLIILRVKFNKKISEWADLLKKFVVFLVEKQDIKFDGSEGKGVTIIFDCNGAGITNVDIDFLQFVVGIMRDYYPKLLTAVIVHEMPFILTYVFKLVQSWLPEDQRKLIHLVSKKDINNYVTPEELPDFMGGSNKMSYKIVPKDVPTAQELGEKLGMKKKEIDKLVNHVEPLINVA